MIDELGFETITHNSELQTQNPKPRTPNPKKE